MDENQLTNQQEMPRQAKVIDAASKKNAVEKDKLAAVNEEV